MIVSDTFISGVIAYLPLGSSFDYHYHKNIPLDAASHVGSSTLQILLNFPPVIKAFKFSVFIEGKRLWAYNGKLRLW